MGPGEVNDDLFSLHSLKMTKSSSEESADPVELHERFGIRLRLVSADELRQGSSGSLQTDRIFSADKNSFHSDGLFSETIFGPAAGWNPSKITAPLPSGHIELPAPVFHPLFRSGLASRAILAVLGFTPLELNQLLKGLSCVITDPADSEWAPGALVEVEAYQAAAEKSGSTLRPLYQAEAVRWLLQRAKVDSAIARAKLDPTDNNRVVRVIRHWFDTGVRMEWLVLEVLPVIHSAL